MSSTPNTTASTTRMSGSTPATLTRSTPGESGDTRSDMTRAEVGTTSKSAPPLRQRVERIISLIRPAVQSDGGDLELVDVTADGVVQIRLHGACVGCPSSTVTLQMGVERNLKAHIPEVRAVQAVA